MVAIFELAGCVAADCFELPLIAIHIARVFCAEKHNLTPTENIAVFCGAPNEYGLVAARNCNFVGMRQNETVPIGERPRILRPQVCANAVVGIQKVSARWGDGWLFASNLGREPTCQKVCGSLSGIFDVNDNFVSSAIQLNLSATEEYIRP